MFNIKKGEAGKVSHENVKKKRPKTVRKNYAFRIVLLVH